MKRTARFRLVTSFLIAAALAAASYAGLATGLFQGTQLRFLDALFPTIGPHPGIAIVEIDDKSLSTIGTQWPWDRSIHADLIRRISEGGAVLIAYDVTFSEESEPEQDAALGDAIADAGNVVLAAAAAFEGKPGRDILQAVTVDRPLALLSEEAAAVAHANVVPDPDGVVRTIPLVIESAEGDLIPSLSFSLFSLANEAIGPVTLRPDGVAVDGRFVPTGQAKLLDVNFAEGYPLVSAIDVLRGDAPDGIFDNRIVLVGATAVGLGDLRLTPLNKSQGEAGVLVHASALNTMIQEAYLLPEGRWATAISVFLISLFVALAVAFPRVWFSPLVALALLAGFFFVAFRRFDGGSFGPIQAEGGDVANMVYPSLGVVVSFLAALAVRYFTEERERRRVTRVFSRYVAKDVVEEVLAAPEGALATLKGASRPISVLFSDLRGFTAASENSTPEEVVAALNVYLDAMTRAVNEEQGTVDKFMGDCVMAFWGAPRPEPDHAGGAVRAALRMLDYIDESEGKVSGLAVKGCGVGIATGEAVVGNIGSAERLDYTVIGDTVNTASRICGVAGPGEVVVTEGTATIVKDHFRLGPLPSLVVKGKVEPLKVFQVLREGQEAKPFVEGEVMDAAEEKGHFEVAPAKAASYAPVEPVPDREERSES